jgi:predicted Zn-dependent protease
LRFNHFMKSIACLLLFTTASLPAADARLAFALGILEKLRGNKAAADGHFDAARLADPVALPLVRKAVEARMVAGDRAAAVTLYRNLAAARPDDLAIQLVYADFLDQQAGGDSLALKLADQTLGKALAKYPGNTEVIRRLAEHALTRGDRERQLELMELLPDDPQATVLYASISRRLAEPNDKSARSKVDARFLRAVISHPADPMLARAASEHFRESGRLDEAIRILERHAQAAPSSLALRIRLGVLCFNAKRDAEGEAKLKEVLEISPRQALAHQALAKFYRLRDRPQPARIHASEVLRIRGGSPTDFAKLADEWLAADDPRQARLLLEKASFDHPNDIPILEKLAVATRRDPATRDHASRLFREAEAARPTDAPASPAFELESAEALIDSGQSQAAEERLRAAIRAFPPDATRETAAALRRLALLWETENRNAAAAKALRHRADSLER